MRKEKSLSFRLRFLMVIVPSILLVIHLLSDNFEYSFKIDEITVSLLLIALIPILTRYIDTVKFGNLEANFKRLSKSDRELFLIKELAKRAKWTFYDARHTEIHSGKAFLWLLTDFRTKHKREFELMLQEQLDSDNENEVWFASEVIGYFKVKNLKDALNSHIRGIDLKEELLPYKLNCLWASSSFNKYQELFDSLHKDIHSFNRDWIIEAIVQMMLAYETSDGTEGKGIFEQLKEGLFELKEKTNYFS